MAGQMPGELIANTPPNSTGSCSNGAPALNGVVSGAGAAPAQGARCDVAFEGPVIGQKLRGTVKGVDYVNLRPDGRGQLHIHAEITTDDGKKIALFADGAATFKDGPPVGELHENATPATSERDYAWVNPLQVWAPGTVDLAKGEVHIKGSVVSLLSGSPMRPGVYGPPAVLVSGGHDTDVVFTVKNPATRHCCIGHDGGPRWSTPGRMRRLNDERFDPSHFLPALDGAGDVRPNAVD